MCACFYLETGFNKFFHTSAQMGISCIKCVLEDVWKTNSQNSQPTQLVRYFEVSIVDKTDHQILHLSICIQFSVAMETVNPKFDVQVASKK